jgi:murein DD-endopeptidase MepM/ murein hydrolase activator NlpD
MSRADRFDRGDFEARYMPRPVLTESAAEPEPAVRPQAQVRTESASVAVDLARGQAVQWPIARYHIKRVGESVLADRNGHGRPHKGIDLFADAGTPVLASSAGEVLRVVDGRHSGREAQRRAGLFIDVRGQDTRVYRYLHLGEVSVKPGASVHSGTVLGAVAAAHTSGLASAPHVHFEVRQGDYDPKRRDYGAPVDPLRLLPPLRA